MHMKSLLWSFLISTILSCQAFACGIGGGFLSSVLGSSSYSYRERIQSAPEMYSTRPPCAHESARAYSQSVVDDIERRIRNLTRELDQIVNGLGESPPAVEFGDEIKFDDEIDRTRLRRKEARPAASHQSTTVSLPNSPRFRVSQARLVRRVNH